MIASRTLLGVVVFSSAFGCGASAQTGPTEQTLPTTIVTPLGAEDLREILERADAALAAESYAEAESLYARALEHDLTGEFRLRSLLGVGTARDLAANSLGALEAYERYVGIAPEGLARRRIEVRAVRLLVYLERYDAAEKRARIVDASDLGPLERVALLAARALGALERGDEATAEHEISAARGILDPLGVDFVERLPLDVAALAFAEGELARRRAGRIRFDPLPPDFADVLEARCRLVLDAQARYSEAMRAKNVHYSAMAGVRVGELYRELHHDLLTMPPPAAATTLEKRQLVEGALRLRYAVLLDKAAAMMESTLGLLARSEAAAVEPDRDWSARARASLEAIERARRDEERALGALPYTRAQLERALRDLEAKKASEAAEMTVPPGKQ